MKGRKPDGEITSKKGRMIFDPHQTGDHQKHTTLDKYKIAMYKYVVSVVDNKAEREADKQLAKRADAVKEATESLGEKIVGRMAEKEIAINPGAEKQILEIVREDNEYYTLPSDLSLLGAEEQMKRMAQEQMSRRMRTNPALHGMRDIWRLSKKVQKFSDQASQKERL